MKIRKKTFLLLELMIGIALLALFALPSIGSPFFLMQSEIVSLERMELERISEVQFAHLKEKLYKNEIPWDVIAKEEMGEPIKGETTLNLLGFKKHTFETKTYIWTKRQHEGKDHKESFHLVGIKMQFIPKPKNGHKVTPITFVHRLLIKKSL